MPSSSPAYLCSYSSRDTNGNFAEGAVAWSDRSKNLHMYMIATNCVSSTDFVCAI